MAAAEQAAENHGDERSLTWQFRKGIYTSIPTCTHSQNSLAAAEPQDIFPWIIFQMITKTIPTSSKMGIRNAMKQGILL